MVRQELVRQKLTLLDGYLRELKRHRTVTADQYAEPGGPRREIERLLQLIVEVASDVNTHIAAEEGSPPASYHDSFLAAARVGAIPADLAGRLAPSAGLRNAIVHGYGSLDDARVLAAVPVALDDFSKFIAAVVRWLDERETE